AYAIVFRGKHCAAPRSTGTSIRISVSGAFTTCDRLHLRDARLELARPVMQRFGILRKCTLEPRNHERDHHAAGVRQRVFTPQSIDIDRAEHRMVVGKEKLLAPRR